MGCFDIGDEPVPESRHGLDVPRLPRIVAELPPQLSDYARESIVRDRGIAPNGGDQLLLAHCPSPILYQMQQYPDRLRLQWEGYAVPKHLKRARAHFDRIELITQQFRRHHSSITSARAAHHVIRRKDHAVVTTITNAPPYSAVMRFLTIVLLTASALAAGPYLTASQVYINGKGPYQFVVDTGAQSSAVTERVARAAAIQARYRVEQVTATGTRLIPAGLANEISFGETTVVEAEVLIGGVPGLPAVEGVLGQSFLSRVDYLLDYKSGKLVLQPDATGLTGVSLPFELLNGRPAIRAVVGGQDRTLILDSGAPALVLFGAPPLSTPFARGFVETSSGSATGAMRREQVRIGSGRTRRLDAVHLPGAGPDRRASGLLPTSVFRWVYVNNTERFVIFSPE